MARYGRIDCEHEWVYRKDGWEGDGQCVPTVCKKCGAFGCLCDLDRDRSGPRPSQEKFFSEGLTGDANVNGQWINPYVKKTPKNNPDYVCGRCGLVWDESVDYCGACGSQDKKEK